MARQRYYGEKFKPTRGAFGGTSNYNKKLKLQVELREQLERMETAKAESDDKPEQPESNPTKETTQQTNVTDRTE